MPDSKISALSAATELRVGDETVIARAGASLKATGAMVRGITYSTRSTNTILGLGDFGKAIDITATITQTFEADETLGNGWWVILRNAGAGTVLVTLDPATTETIDGLTTLTMVSGETRLIICNGAGGNFNSILLAGARPWGFDYYRRGEPA